MTRLYDFEGPRLEVPYNGFPAADLAAKITAWLASVPEEHRHTARVQPWSFCCDGERCTGHDYELHFCYSRPLTRLEAWRNQPEVRAAEQAAATAAKDFTYPRGDKYWPPMPEGWEPTP